jgi:hypothetical protein
MNKRNFIVLAGSLAAASVPFAVAAEAASQRNTATWKVPPGVTKIRVRSWNADGSADMDRTLSVEPNQTFRIDAIEG